MSVRPSVSLSACVCVCTAGCARVQGVNLSQHHRLLPFGRRTISETGRIGFVHGSN